MTRDDLEAEIRTRMYGDYEPQTIEEDVCEHCGNIIDDNPHEEMIPEHGGDTTHRVVWCDKGCKSDWIQDSV